MMRVKFPPGKGLHRELKRRIDGYFRGTGFSRRDCPQIYLKAGILLAWFGASYALLVFAASSWWQALPLAISVGLAMAGIGFNLQHDGAHSSFSRRRLINRVMAGTLDLLGGSSYVWHWKHNIFHHGFTNVAGADDDLNGGPMVRLAPHQPRYWVHRFQYLYVWVLYGILPLKWQLFDDFSNVISGRIGSNRFPRPGAWQLFCLLAGKGLFWVWALVIPLWIHASWVVVAYFFVTSFTLGITLSLVFQLAHCVEEANFPRFSEAEARSDREWAVHQIETTVDFARGRRLLSWYLGGLNYQIEHHLFPGICHVHYRALSEIVETTCAEFNVSYFAHESLRKALSSHLRWLYRLGQPRGSRGQASAEIEAPCLRSPVPSGLDTIG
jgi:linoleoyl-CoA desaturase